VGGLSAGAVSETLGAAADGATVPADAKRRNGGAERARGPCGTMAQSQRFRVDVWDVRRPALGAPPPLCSARQSSTDGQFVSVSQDS